MAIATSTMFVSSSMTHQSMVILPLSRSVKGAAIAANPSAKAKTQSATRWRHRRRARASASERLTRANRSGCSTTSALTASNAAIESFFDAHRTSPSVDSSVAMPRRRCVFTEFGETSSVAAIASMPSSSK